MLRELAPDDDDDEYDDDHVARPEMRDHQTTSHAQAYTAPSYPPQAAESAGERRERLQQEEMDREDARRQEHFNAAPFVLGDEVDVHTPPAAHTREPLNAQGGEGNRTSLEGTGWRAVA